MGWWWLRWNNWTDEQKKGKEGKTAETTDDPREQAGRYSIINDGRGDASWLAWLNISLGFVCAFVCWCVHVCVGTGVSPWETEWRTERQGRVKCACWLGELMIPVVWIVRQYPGGRLIRPPTDTRMQHSSLFTCMMSGGLPSYPVSLFVAHLETAQPLWWLSWRCPEQKCHLITSLSLQESLLAPLLG